MVRKGALAGAEREPRQLWLKRLLQLPCYSIFLAQDLLSYKAHIIRFKVSLD